MFNSCHWSVSWLVQHENVWYCVNVNWEIEQESSCQLPHVELTHVFSHFHLHVLPLKLLHCSCSLLRVNHFVHWLHRLHSTKPQFPQCTRSFVTAISMVKTFLKIDSKIPKPNPNDPIDLNPTNRNHILLSIVRKVFTLYQYLISSVSQSVLKQ